MSSVVFVIGAPGAGKGTQCARLAASIDGDYAHISAGDVLRAEVRDPASRLGAEIRARIDAGLLVPTSCLVELLAAAMRASGRRNFLIDGFPRSEENLDGWEATMSTTATTRLVILYECPDDACVERCLGRASAGEPRADDTRECLATRLAVHRETSGPVIARYEARGLLRRVDGALPANEVFVASARLLL